MATTEKSSTRFLDSYKEPEKMLMPISGFDKVPLVSLEEAVKPLVHILPDIKNYVWASRVNCDKKSSDGLTHDESASIMIYTMDWQPLDECLYFVLNSTLRSENRNALRPWFPYLKLIITALSKLPSTACILYRGIKLDLSASYPVGKTITWWSFSSCTKSIDVLQNDQFLGSSGIRTMFAIETTSGKDISRYAYFHQESEVLLLPARHFEVRGCLRPAKDLYMIQLREIEPPCPLLIINSGITSSSRSYGQPTVMLNATAMAISTNSNTE
jgi:hypothetical protein